MSADGPIPPVAGLCVHHRKRGADTINVCVLQIDTNPTVPWQYFFANRIVSLTSQTTATICFSSGRSRNQRCCRCRCVVCRRCSRVRVRRVVVPKNIQPARTKCSWTTTLTGKLSSFGLDPRRSSNFSFCFEHSDSVWLRVPRPWPGMPRSANLASVKNCCWIHPTLYLKWMPRRQWRDKPNRPFRAQASLSKRLQTRLLKMPQMWRLLMRVEERIMVTVTWSLIFNGARAHTKKHSALERLSSLPSVFSSTFERSLFHDPLDTLALKGLSSANHAQPALE